MTTKKYNSDEPSKSARGEQADKSLQLSSKLNEAINDLRLLPKYQEITIEHGEAESIMAATIFLKKTRPDLFDRSNPADGLAFLYAGMD